MSYFIAKNDRQIIITHRQCKPRLRSDFAIDYDKYHKRHKKMTLRNVSLRNSTANIIFIVLTTVCCNKATYCKLLKRSFAFLTKKTKETTETIFITGASTGAIKN